MSNNDEITEMFMNQISSLKNQLEEEIKKHKLETDKLEKIIKAKNKEIEKLEIKTTWDMAEDNSSVIKDQLEATKKMNAAFQADILQKSKEINNFRKEVTDLKNEISALKEEIEKLNTDKKNMNMQYETIKNQFDLLQKQKEAMKEKEEKLKKSSIKKESLSEEIEDEVGSIDEFNNANDNRSILSSYIFSSVRPTESNKSFVSSIYGRSESQDLLSNYNEIMSNKGMRILPVDINNTNKEVDNRS